MQLPKIREELQLRHGSRSQDGSPTWIIYDPIANRFYHIGWLEFELLSRWHLRQSSLIIDATKSETTLHPSDIDIQRLLIFLQQNLLVNDASPQWSNYLRTRHKQQKKTLITWLIHNYLFFRLPILQSDELVTRLYNSISFFITKYTLWGLSILGIFGIHLVIRQWDLFVHTFVNTLTISGLIGYTIMLIVAKSIHELGHALVAKHFGLRVPRIGIAFLVMIPVLYTDAGETWLLSDHKKRLLISASGILSEIALAIIALFLWGVCVPGELRNLFYFLAVVSLIRTLLINSSPFLRFDGYYILSDFLDFPNLQQRAFAVTRHLLKTRILGVQLPRPEYFSKSMTSFLVAYSLATWLYRLIVFTGIAIAVYHYFFKALGILAFIIEMYFFILMPVIHEFKSWSEVLPMVSQQRKRIFWVTLTLVLSMCIIPLKSTIYAPAYIGAHDKWQIFAPYSAKVIKSTPNNTSVKQGDILFVLDAHEQRQQASIASLQATELRERARRLSIASDQGRERASNWVAEAREKEQVSQSQHAELKRLIIRAETDGILLDTDDGIKPGVYVTSRDSLGVLINPKRSVVDAFITEHDLKRIKIGDKCVFWSSGPPPVKYKGKVISIGQNRVSTLPNHFLSDKSGGDIETTNDHEKRLVPTQALYRVRIETSNIIHINKVKVGNVSISGKYESIAGRFMSQALSVLAREVGL